MSTQLTADRPATSTAQPWALGAPRPSYQLRNVRAVLPDRILENATLTVRDGRIQDVTAGGGSAVGAPGAGPVVDGQNLLLVPGFVDVHSDALENERTPRPGAEVPIEFALASFEGRVAGAGTTTMFHGAAFQHKNTRGVPRSAERALDVCRVADTTPSYRVDHRVLHRLDVLSADGAEVLRRRVSGLEDGAPAPLVSHEDHTPGQGQYADPAGLRRFMIERDGLTGEEADARIAQRVEEAADLAAVREANLAWLSDLATAGRVRLMGHDPDSPEEIDALVARGGAVAEFPTTVPAARRARERDLVVVAGAPNVLRGGSHSGNVSARELVSLGLVDALASDYLPTALLASAALLAAERVVDLPRAVGLITSGPARVAGLPDRGVIAAGMRADLALVDDGRGTWPYAVATLRAEAVS
ncbi:alpha-D-ribose 1-methylphosphonate 5-triphosphate diphosphatase [Georgenia alba]|uniref:Alpha-D-ribose 1-methylphosphonate 5-triphosphate diphosphatase n=1 Tax=Georgenia alba TaxID=2233858 RepID=A0ABW2Q1Y1_9MICO